jgi:ArsR family transcriptional regulator, virulence genes transcriptional regulator
MKIRSEPMRTAAGEASGLLKALANPHRLMIVCQLIEKDRSVGELAGFLDLRDSTVSQHLAVLRRDGIVTARRDGQTIWYSIGSDPARDVVHTLYRAFCAPAAACMPPARRTVARKRGKTLAQHQ